MAYVTGAASSFADLAAALRNACVANGWSQNSNVIWKGTSYFEITSETNFVRLHGGTGQSGGVISGKSPSGCRVGGSYMTFPVTYEINIFENPDEVYMVVNYNSDYYQQMSFGTSDVAGAGGGPWITGAHNTLYTSNNNGLNIDVFRFIQITSYCYASVSTNSVGLFNKGSWSGEVSSSFVYTDALGSPGWYGYDSGATAARLKDSSPSRVAGLLLSLPSAFNNTNVLLPIKAMLDMGSNGRATVANPRNARFCRIDYNTPGDIVTYGGDQWKIYPWLRKDANNRNGQSNGTSTPPNHSGTFGYAIRYTGI